MQEIIEIEKHVCKMYDINYHVYLKNKNCRNRKFIEIRQIVCYVVRNVARLPYDKIGTIMGKNHATIIHGIKQVNDLMTFDKEFRLRVESALKFAKPFFDENAEPIFEDNSEHDTAASLIIKHFAMEFNNFLGEPIISEEFINEYLKKIQWKNIQS